jgi:hypothetical protein
MLAPMFGSELWDLDDFIGGDRAAEFVIEFLANREVDIVHIVTSKFGADLLPAVRYCYSRMKVVVDVGDGGAQSQVFSAYVASRYGNLVDVFVTSSATASEELEAAHVSSSKIRRVPRSIDAETQAAVTSEIQTLYHELIGSLVG